MATSWTDLKSTLEAETATAEVGRAGTRIAGLEMTLRREQEAAALAPLAGVFGDVVKTCLLSGGGGGAR